MGSSMNYTLQNGFFTLLTECIPKQGETFLWGVIGRMENNYENLTISLPCLSEVRARLLQAPDASMVK